MRVKDHSRIVITSLDSIQPTGFISDAERYGVKEAARRLLTRLETPFEQSLRLYLETPVLIAAIRTALDLGIWKKWTENNQVEPGAAVDLEQLLKWTNKLVEPNLLRRLFRHLAALYILHETGVDTWKPTAYSLSLGDTVSDNKEITQCGVDHIIPTGINLPRFLQKYDYREPSDSEDFDNCHEINGTDFSTLRATGADGKGSSFMGLMKALQNYNMAWTEIYDTQKLISGADISPGKPLFVDIGGAHRRDTSLLLGKHADLPEGVLIMQDTPESIAKHDKSIDPRVVKQAYDFFSPQLQLHARTYFLNAVPHEWSDANCVRMFLNIKAAFKPGYSKLLIGEVVLPKKGATSLMTTLDLQLMSFMSRSVRTEKHWERLLGEAGFKIVEISSHPRALESVIEADLM